MNPHHDLHLRKTELADLDEFFRFQIDPEAIQMAAFTPKDPTDKKAYLEKYTKLVNDPAIHMLTILVGDAIAGSISKFELEGDAELTYWIDRKFWGQGLGTWALREFLTREKTRPLYGRTAYDNIGSQKVLEKCGFERIGADQGFANARQAVIEEYIYRLDQDSTEE